VHSVTIFGKFFLAHIQNAQNVKKYPVSGGISGKSNLISSLIPDIKKPDYPAGYPVHRKKMENNIWIQGFD
jgi:hypothetical protein